MFNASFIGISASVLPWFLWLWLLRVCGVAWAGSVSPSFRRHNPQTWADLWHTGQSGWHTAFVFRNRGRCRQPPWCPWTIHLSWRVSFQALFCKVMSHTAASMRLALLRLFLLLSVLVHAEASHLLWNLGSLLSRICLKDWVPLSMSRMNKGPVPRLPFQNVNCLLSHAFNCTVAALEDCDLQFFE